MFGAGGGGFGASGTGFGTCECFLLVVAPPLLPDTLRTPGGSQGIDVKLSARRRFIRTDPQKGLPIHLMYVPHFPSPERQCVHIASCIGARAEGERRVRRRAVLQENVFFVWKCGLGAEYICCLLAFSAVACPLARF